MDQVDPRQRALRDPCQQFGGVAREQPDIADVMRFDLSQNLRHAVDIGFAADEAGCWESTRFGDQMLASAKSDFETHAIGGWIEQIGEFGWTGAGDVERK